MTTPTHTPGRREGGVGESIRIPPKNFPSANDQHSNALKDFLPICLRPFEETDWHFILNSWKSGFKYERLIWEPCVFFPLINRAIHKLRERGASFIIACDIEDNDQIFGWICFEAPLVHYVFVKRPFRKANVARRLIELVPRVNGEYICTFWTRDAEHISRKHPLRRADIF